MPSIELEILAATKSAEKNIKDFEKTASTHLKKIEGSFGLIKTAAIAAVGFLAGREVINFFKESIQAASEQEDAINDLNIALKLSGQYSNDLSNSLVGLANELQATTKYEDDAVIKTSAMIQTLGRLSGEGLQRATKDAVDLSAALGIDLTTAATMVGKAAQGEIGSLKRYGIAIQEGKTDAETFTNTLKRLEAQFGGAAAAQVNTYSGSIARLKNTWSDFKETVGGFITGNKLLPKFFNLVKSNIEKLTSVLEKNKVAINNMIEQFLLMTAKIFPLFIRGFVGLIAAYKGFNEESQKTAIIFKNWNDLFTKGWDAFRGKGVATSIDEIRKAAGEVNAELMKDVELENFAADLLAAADEADNLIESLKGISKESVNATSNLPNVSEPIQKAGEKTKGTLEKVSGVVNSISGGFKSTLITILNSAGWIGQIISGLVNIFSMGKKEFKEFAKSFINVAVEMPTLMAQNVGIFVDQVLKSLPHIIEEVAKSISATTFLLVVDIVKSVVKNIPKLLKSMPKALINTITEFISSAASSLVDIVNMIVDVFANSDMIVNTSKMIPELVIALTQAFSDPAIIAPLITNLSINLPMALVQAFGDPYLTQNVINGFLKELSRYTAQGFFAELKAGWEQFMKEMSRITVRFDTTELDKIRDKLKILPPDWLDKLKIKTPAWLQQFTDTVNTLVSSGGGGDFIKKITGKAKGGLIYAANGFTPKGTDTVPAMLTPGELVIPRNTTSNLFNLINGMAENMSSSGAGSHGDQNLTINLRVGEKDLANVLLNLNKQGFRVA